MLSFDTVLDSGPDALIETTRDDAAIEFFELKADSLIDEGKSSPRYK